MAIVLLVEDDEALGQQVSNHLEKAGFSVVWWKRGRRVDADSIAGASLIVLDLMLPDVPGLDMLKNIREIGDVPVLVLSARQDSHDKVRALHLGADDYVTKPFWPDELLERVHARLRRPGMQRSSELRIGALVLDEAKQEARYGDRRLEMTRVELGLLIALGKSADRPVSRSWLLSNVLDPDREATERTLDVHISRLRKKLGNPSLIETVWGIGYRLRSEPSA
jgi:two-component system response regulator MtrA